MSCTTAKSTKTGNIAHLYHYDPSISLDLHLPLLYCFQCTSSSLGASKLFTLMADRLHLMHQEQEVNILLRININEVTIMEHHMINIGQLTSSEQECQPRNCRIYWQAYVFTLITSTKHRFTSGNNRNNSASATTAIWMLHALSKHYSCTTAFGRILQVRYYGHTVAWLLSNCMITMYLAHNCLQHSLSIPRENSRNRSGSIVSLNHKLITLLSLS
jgi:hypothetical protein